MFVKDTIFIYKALFVKDKQSGVLSKCTLFLSRSYHDIPTRRSLPCQFHTKGGNEFYGKHYAIILTPPDKTDGTLLAVPLTGKKQVKVPRWYHAG